MLTPAPSLAFLVVCFVVIYSMLITHEEVQEKPYKLEMSWLTEETEWKHQRISDELMYVHHVPAQLAVCLRRS